jgi:hypothetical protein
VTVAPEHDRAFKEVLDSAGVPMKVLGAVEGRSLEFRGQAIAVEELQEAYESALSAIGAIL